MPYEVFLRISLELEVNRSIYRPLLFRIINLRLAWYYRLSVWNFTI